MRRYLLVPLRRGGNATPWAISVRSASTSKLGGTDMSDSPMAKRAVLTATKRVAKSTVSCKKPLSVEAKEAARLKRKKLSPDALNKVSLEKISRGGKFEESRSAVTKLYSEGVADELPAASSSRSRLATSLSLLGEGQSPDQSDPVANALKRLVSDQPDTNDNEVRRSMVIPRSTVFASSLDSVEQSFREDVVKRRSVREFSEEEVYDLTSRVWESTPDAHMASDRNLTMESREASRASVRNSTKIEQFPRKYHLRKVAAEAEMGALGGLAASNNGTCKRRTATAPFMRVVGGDDDSATACSTDLPQEDNPHFPVESAPLPSVRAEAPPTRFVDSSPTPTYDAYVTRGHDHTLIKVRDSEYWDKHENRDRVESMVRQRTEEVSQFLLREGPMDNVRHNGHSLQVRRETMKWLRANTVNEMIQESFVRIQKVVPADGSNPIVFAGEEQSEIPLAEARAIARQHGLDLICTARIFSTFDKRGFVGVCTVADHRQLLRDTVQLVLHADGGIQPPNPASCVEVPFTGGIHPHGIRFKSIGIAKMLVRQIPIRVNLTKFGSPREGFPILQIILDEIKKQCLPLKAYHSASPVQATYNEIFCYLLPSTAMSPKLGVSHPTDGELTRARDERIMQGEKEVWFDDYYDQPSLRERCAYGSMLEQGTAWSFKDDGLSLKRQRDIKIMLGYLPKGNKEIYAARGDVDVRFPFRTMHPTTTEKWLDPPESNLDKAGRGAAVLGKRMEMDISTMHEKGETPENPSSLERFYYKVSGPALEAGELKESLGLKTNRKRVPGLGPGWATLGMGKSNEDTGFAAK